MPLVDETAGLDEVAAAIGRSPEWLRRHWLKLATEQGFPRKHPSGWTWPREAVRLWLRAGGFVQPVAPSNDNVGTPEAAWQAAAEAHYGVSQ